jgi:class 3 adenylate cyclase
MKSLSSQVQKAFWIVSILPLLLLAGFTYQEAIYITSNQVQRNFQNITHQIVAQLERSLASRKNNLQFLTRLLSIREGILEDFDKDGLLAELLIAYRDENPEFAEIYLLKNKENSFTPFASSNPSRMKESCNFEDSLREIVRKDGEIPPLVLSTKNMMSIPGLKRSAFPLLLPFRAEDEEIHFMVGMIDLETLQLHFRSLEIDGEAQGPDQFLVIVDNANDILFKPVSNQSNLGSQLTGKEGLVLLGQKEYLVHRHHSELLKWTIYVLQNTQITFAWKEKLLFAILILLGVVTMVTLLLSSKMVRGLMIPIDNLKLAAQKYGGSQFDYKIPFTHISELYQVSEVFQEMAHSLKTANQELHNFNEQLESQVEERTGQLAQRNMELDAISTQLAKYLSPQVYGLIFQGNSEVKLGARRKKLTIFFSDIKGFTTISEEMESEDLTKMLNSYLNEMAKIALDFGGTIDKFIGDAVMVFFGDPESRGESEDALHCVRMAFSMQERMKSLRLKWKREGWSHEFHIRCGINTGYATVGNFGSDDRMDYTLVGRAVNLASRLESNASVDEILISNSTYSLVQDHVECLTREPIQVKGIQRPIQTYEIIRVLEDQQEDLVLHEQESLFLQVNLGKFDGEKKAAIRKEIKKLVEYFPP